MIHALTLSSSLLPDNPSVAEKTGFTRAESEDALQAVLDTLTEVCCYVLCALK